MPALLRRLTTEPWSHWGSDSFSYYGSHTRAYQLLSGALLAIAFQRRPTQLLRAAPIVQSLSLAAIAVPATGEGWTAIRELTRQALAARGSKATDAQVDLLLRWLTSFITVPSDDASRNSQATELAKSLK